MKNIYIYILPVIGVGGVRGVSEDEIRVSESSTKEN